MDRRQLKFSNFEQVLDDARNLHQSGYQQTGNWNLSQILEHLRFTIEGATDERDMGFPVWLKWIFKKLFLKKIIGGGVMKAGFKTAPSLMPQESSAPPQSTEEGEELKRFESCIHTFVNHKGEYATNAAFGKLTREEWHKLQLTHAELHLSFLIPL